MRRCESWQKSGRNAEKMAAEYIERDSAAAFAYDCGAVYVSNRLSDKNAFPAADVAPVRHGRWLLITAGYRNFGWCCSECGRSVSINCDEELRQSKLEKEYPFCHCGARMDLEVTNDS